MVESLQKRWDRRHGGEEVMPQAVVHDKRTWNRIDYTSSDATTYRIKAGLEIRTRNIRYDMFASNYHQMFLSLIARIGEVIKTQF